jgi:hypothetical protein
VGDTGPGGGKVFYVAPTTFASPGSACGTACKYLEAAPIGWITAATPAGQTNCKVAGTSTADPKCEWSGNTTTRIGTTSNAIGAGYANTNYDSLAEQAILNRFNIGAGQSILSIASMTSDISSPVISIHSSTVFLSLI